jgi:propanol-preferring alcohol dehydrogenase
MHAMVLEEAGGPLRWRELPSLQPAQHEVVLQVEACAVCRTDLHLIDSELPRIPYPIIPGHQVVGRVLACGDDARIDIGQRVGVAWLGWTCGACRYCTSGLENLCDDAVFNGYQRNGGYADQMLADSRYVFTLSEDKSPADIAPLLCGGLIGYRSLRMTGKAEKLGIYGFGAAAHIIAQVAVGQGRQIFAFTRPGDQAAMQLARECGAAWAGPSDTPAPVELDAAIIFAPAGELVPRALRAVRKGGTVVCGGIHMSDIPSFPYADLWGERQLRSVANMTRSDGREFLEIAAAADVRAHVQTWPLQNANEVLAKLRGGELSGTAVLIPG